MATTTYKCKSCEADLNLTNDHIYPPDFYFESGNKNTISFSRVDPEKFKFETQDKIKPFFESLSYWGIQRKETKIKCMNCGKLLGHVYDDGPPVPSDHNAQQFHFGPSQVIPRNPRFRFKIKALLS